MAMCDLCGTVSRPGDMFCSNCGERLQILSTERISLPPKLRFTVLTRDGHTCRYCGRSAPEVVLHIDHIIPLAKGGTNDLDNLITACADCNLGKGTTLPDLDHVDVSTMLLEEIARTLDQFVTEKDDLWSRQFDEDSEVDNLYWRDSDRLQERLDIEFEYYDFSRGSGDELLRRQQIELQKLEWKQRDRSEELHKRHMDEIRALSRKYIGAFDSFRSRRSVSNFPELAAELAGVIEDIRSWEERELAHKEENLRIVRGQGTQDLGRIDGFGGPDIESLTPPPAAPPTPQSGQTYVWGVPDADTSATPNAGKKRFGFWRK